MTTKETIARAEPAADDMSNKIEQSFDCIIEGGGSVEDVEDHESRELILSINDHIFSLRLPFSDEFLRTTFRHSLYEKAKVTITVESIDD